jgi:hypothetical protein
VEEVKVQVNPMVMEYKLRSKEVDILVFKPVILEFISMKIV